MEPPEKYKELFEGIESTLIAVGLDHGVGDLKRQLDEFKTVANRRLTDSECYQQIVEITFYSGFRAATVDERLPSIHEWFHDYKTVARFGTDQVDQMLSEPRMIANRRKLQACVTNARAFDQIVRTHGSFQSYLDSFRPRQSFNNLLKLSGKADCVEAKRWPLSNLQVAGNRRSALKDDE